MKGFTLDQIVKIEIEQKEEQKYNFSVTKIIRLTRNHARLPKNFF